MKKVGTLMLGLSLIGFSVGCGGTESGGGDTTPPAPAPPSDTDDGGSGGDGTTGEGMDAPAGGEG